jgi:hypothetical protein
MMEKKASEIVEMVPEAESIFLNALVVILLISLVFLCYIGAVHFQD